MSSAASPVSHSGLTRAKAATIGGHRLRVSPWQGQTFVAVIGPARANHGPTVSEVQRGIVELEHNGVKEAVTPALSPFEAEPFLAAGFELHEELHLLARYLDSPPPAPKASLRRGRPWDQRRVLEIDRNAFESFWQFDKFSLKEAQRATPSSRFMVSKGSTGITGYSVTGRAGGRGYLQRLAVNPKAQGRGIGTSMVHDCLRWLHRKQVGIALVNTQHRNHRALELYERLGFVRQQQGLLVLHWNSPD